MGEQAWGEEHARALAVFLSGDGLNEVDVRGRAVRDDSFLVMFNADANEVRFVLPSGLVPRAGELLIDTSRDASMDPGRTDTPFDAGEPYVLAARSLALVRFRRRPEP
jgi:glycogen operon protein